MDEGIVGNSKALKATGSGGMMILSEFEVRLNSFSYDMTYLHCE